MISRYHAIIMAGGVGSRFWPLSRNQQPKQFLDILGTGHTLIQMTFQRLKQFIPLENIWVVSHQDYSGHIKNQLPEIQSNNILLEPDRKNTAACLMYASIAVSERDPNAILFIAPSDHLILNESQFTKDVLDSFKFIENHEEYILTFGIRASRPDTGYGYIHFESKNILSESIFSINKFVEKPDHSTALIYLESGNYVWNSGMFIWTNKIFQSEMKKYSKALTNIFEQHNIHTELLSIYNQCESISIDYALMEKTNKAVVKTVDFGWSDLGTWGSLYELKTKDEYQNSLNGTNILIENSSNCLIENSGKQLIAIEGLDDYIVVNTDDVLLICKKTAEQKIKDIVKKLEFRDNKKYT